MRAATVADFAQWRDAARALLAADVPPAEIAWIDPGRDSGLLPGMVQAAPTTGGESVRVPRAFVERAELVALHRSAARWPLLYRVLWRLTHGEPALLQHLADADVQGLQTLEKNVRRDEHKMHAFVRFRRVLQDGVEHFIAYHRPEHRILRLAAPFFARRFASLRFTLLTPEESATWDGQTLRFGPGAPASAAPEGDALETLWRTYYASIFNPARLNLRAMQQELPRRHWSTLPEAQLIAPLARRAATRVEGMLARESSESERYLPTLPTLSTLRAALPACQACGLCGPATQAVFGEGPEHARLVLVGEQPGDEEDRLGRPFVGPAGVVLDAALQEAGIDRREVYLTNAVKHFKFEERGRRRIHQKPSAGEIRACKGWLQAELTTLQPQVLVCLGATAAQALLGPRFSVSRTVGSPSPCPPSPACSRPTTRRRSCAWMT